MKRVIIASSYRPIEYRMQWDVGGRRYSIVRMNPYSSSCQVKIQWEQDGRGLTKHAEFGLSDVSSGRDQYIYDLDNPDFKLYAEDAINEEYRYNPTVDEDDYYPEDEEEYTPRMGYDYSPSAPWGAPGMSERDFI